MRRFITKTMFISLPLLIVVILMEVFLRNIPNDYLLKKEYLNKHSTDIETLILGSSHSYYGFNPTFFLSKTFNSSHISQTLDYDFEILQKYQSKFKNLKTIILPISYFSLFEKLEETSELWRVKNYILYYEMNTAKSLINYSEVLSLRININLKRLVSYYILGKSPITCTELGWGTNYKSENAQDLIKSGEPRALVNTYINKVNYKPIFDDNKLIINNIVEWCKNRDIRLILLTPPAFETYCKNLNKEQLNITIETAKRIGIENNNCIYLNLLNDTRFDAKDFYDADHLSEIGAEKLSKLINEMISNWE